MTPRRWLGITTPDWCIFSEAPRQGSRGGFHLLRSAQHQIETLVPKNMFREPLTRWPFRLFALRVPCGLGDLRPDDWQVGVAVMRRRGLGGLDGVADAVCESCGAAHAQAPNRDCPVAARRWLWLPRALR
jgi:hypothetical protein